MSFGTWGDQINRHAHHRHAVAVVSGFVFGDDLIFGLTFIMGDNPLHPAAGQTFGISIGVSLGRVSASFSIC